MIKNIFTNIDENLHEELYKDLPDTNIGKRIKKVMLRLHIDRIQFAKSLDYFHKYYYVYYNDHQKVFLKWIKKNGYTYEDLGNMITSSGTTVHHFVSSMYKLSYKLYLQLEEIGVFR